ncbi:hypothetical protein RhiJN_28415 [Ceratobasidium sp. AG-Ba]|nr:hypothetical protein RhiJN_28415 [Ceratobasidium sp. AG-Ba]
MLAAIEKTSHRFCEWMPRPLGYKNWTAALKSSPSPVLTHLSKRTTFSSTSKSTTLKWLHTRLVGDKVKYTAIGGGNVENSATTGEIVEILTEPEAAGTTGNTVQASEEEPRYVIKNDNTGKSTPYKAANIIGPA